MLASYASQAARSRGRRHLELPAPTRDDFQRDRDRIIHSTAFRRLVYKTQVFINHEGDLFRTRLTHSLEVAQLGRSIARNLGLNEDLVETVALAHDLGHTPFGHAGQDALDECMQRHSGFEHNLQSLRVVDSLELRYPQWDGLNLCFETREGILKRCTLETAQQYETSEPGGVGRRFIDGTQPSLEAQVTNLADEIAYNAHDIDDGVRSGLLTLDQVREVALFDRHVELACSEYPALAAMPPRRILAEAIRRMLSAQVYDVMSASLSALGRVAGADADAARQQAGLIVFSAPMRRESTELKRFLFGSLYRHPQVTAATDMARRIVRDLFLAYRDQPGQMPAEYAQAPDLPRSVADYIAGMTDRFATREHHRLTGLRLFADT